MGWYRYQAIDGNGRKTSGVTEAQGPGALEARLRGAGGWLLAAAESRPPRAEGSAVASSARRKDLAAFFVQMSLLLKAGVPLSQALGRMARDFRKGRLGGVIADLEAKVFGGVSLHAAMEGHPRIFSPEVAAVVQAGEASGRLADAFASLAAYYEWLDRLVADIRQALIYPAVVTGATLLLVLLLFTLVVPKFVGLLQGLALEVPPLTRAVMGVSHVLVVGWPAIAAAAVLAPLGWRFLRKSGRLGRAFDRALIHAPGFGPLVGMFACSRLAHNLGILYGAGIPLLKGLDICRGLVGNKAVAAALAEVRDGVAEGTPLSRCLEEHDVFPPALATMVATGEASGTLGEALSSVADYYNKLIPRTIKLVFGIFDPLVMLMLIGVVGCIALAVVLPILQLWQIR